MNIKKFHVSCALLFSFIILSFSCVVRIVEYQDPRGLIPIEDFQRNLPFSPGGMISLRNFDGAIEITGWDQNKVEVFAQKMVPRPQRSYIRFALPRQDIARIDLERYGDDHIYINTKSPSEQGLDTIVDYYIKTPRFINLKEILARKGDVFIADVYGSAFVRLEEGNIEVDNFSGSLDASVIKGSLQASLYDLRQEDVISFNVQKGNVTLFLQENVNAHIKAFFPDGLFRSEFDSGEQEKQNAVDFKIGSGGTSVYISTSSGDIEIKIIESS